MPSDPALYTASRVARELLTSYHGTRISEVRMAGRVIYRARGWNREGRVEMMLRRIRAEVSDTVERVNGRARSEHRCGGSVEHYCGGVRHDLVCPSDHASDPVADF